MDVAESRPRQGGEDSRASYRERAFELMLAGGVTDTQRALSLVLDYMSPRRVMALFAKWYASARLADATSKLKGGASPGEPAGSGNAERFNFQDEVRRLEIGMIHCAMSLTGGNKARAARLLGLRPTTFHAKLKQYRLRESNPLSAEREG